MSDERKTLEDKWAAEAESEAAGNADINPGDGTGGASDERVTALEARVAELTDALLRQKAEMANFRRRVERDREEHRGEASRELLQRLLPVIDDFERALEAETDNFDAYRSGVELILRSLHEFLVAAGVERLDPHGDPFDPNFHEAVEQAESEEVPEHHVAAVYQPGYLHGGRLLRPARVGVARRPAESAGDQDDA